MLSMDDRKRLPGIYEKRYKSENLKRAIADDGMWYLIPCVSGSMTTTALLHFPYLFGHCCYAARRFSGQDGSISEHDSQGNERKVTTHTKNRARHDHAHAGYDFATKDAANPF